jgi:penicillin-binding protein 1A
VLTGGKTGTTNDGKDVWFIGFTPDLVSGVWMGFDNPTKIMGNAQGGRLAAPAWTAMMRDIYERRKAPAPWAEPEGVVVELIDSQTGMRSTLFCPVSQLTTEYFIPGTEPVGFCPLHGGARQTSVLPPPP